MEVQGFDHLICETRFCITLQANNPGAALVYYTAHSNHVDVHTGIWKDGRNPHRRAATHAFLYGRDGGMDLFCNLFKRHIQHLHSKCRHFREGILPQANRTYLNCNIQPNPVWDSVCAYACNNAYILVIGHSFSCYRLCAFNSLSVGSNGTYGSWIWYYCIVADHQIPRPYKPGCLWHATVDVCHSHNLPFIKNSREVQNLYHGESCNSHR